MDLYLVLKNYLFSWTMKNTSPQSVIRKFNKILSMFGYPKKVLSDNGPLFQSDLLKLYFEFLNIKHRKISLRYPQTNRMIEKFMKVVSKAIKTLVYENRNWKDNLLEVLRSYRSSIHATTGYCAAQLFFNRSLNDKLPTKKEKKSPYHEKVRTRLDSTYKNVSHKFNDKH